MVSIDHSFTHLLSTAKTWIWRGFPISYQSCGEQGPSVIFVHGFGASWGHWRKNLPILSQNCRCYAIDLIGFGGSAKPTPGKIMNYSIETWGEQIGDFCREIVGNPVFLVGNSIGCLVVMQTAVDYPDWVLGVAAINCSLRLLHDRKRGQIPWYRRLGVALLDKILENKSIGYFFFRQLAKPKTIRNILLQAYCHPEAVTDELIEMILKPAMDEGAADVFLAFTRYSQGPLPEDLLILITCPVIVLWGTKDPWEPIELGQKFAEFSTVEKFIPLEGVGHCPQDEAPEMVNPIIQEWILSKFPCVNPIINC